MKTNKNIRKVLMVGAWLMVGAAMLSLLIAAIGKNKKEHCTGYAIRINGNSNGKFITNAEIEQLLKSGFGTNIKDAPVASFNLNKLERFIENNSWVKDAQLFFDSKGKLKIEVEENEPVARVFTASGNSFYLDKSGVKLPLLKNKSEKLPAFTDYIEKRKLNRTDSVFINDIITMSQFIRKDSFWAAQVAQVNIVQGNKFEVIPVMGNQIISFGTIENLEKKFSRLMVFYKQVLAKNEFGIYSLIDLQFNGMVIGTKGEQINNNPSDNNQLRTNVERLLDQGRGVQRGNELPDTRISAERNSNTSDTISNSIPRAIMPQRNDN